MTLVKSMLTENAALSTKRKREAGAMRIEFDYDIDDGTRVLVVGYVIGGEVDYYRVEPDVKLSEDDEYRIMEKLVEAYSD